MTQTASYEIEKGLFLVRQPVAKGAPPKAVEQPTNHLAVIDCSGSMGSDLPQIRAQLKKKLPKLLKEGDTLSIVWFSGLGQFGTLIEAEPVATLGDLAVINTAIDRWLKPVGMTGFKEPLCEVEDLVKRIGKKIKNPFALFFMSDGCDNTWRRPDILATVERVVGGLASSTFVEYGYYADRQLLAAMAAKAGGSHIFAEDFDRYGPVFEAAMAKHPLGGKRIEIKVPGDPIGGFAWAMADGELTTYEVSGGKATAPENTAVLYYLSPTLVGARESVLFEVDMDPNGPIPPALYAAMSLFAVRVMPNVVYPILRVLGDVAFIQQFTNCFGKQAYSSFMDAAKHAAFDSTKRCVNGFNPALVPPDDAFTVLDLIQVLADGDAQLLLDHPSFKYSRVSRARVTADENLSGAEADRLEELRTKLTGERSAKAIKVIQAEIDTLLASKRDALKFVADDAPNGYPINGLVYNEDRPNISLRVKKTGYVDLSQRADLDPKVKSAEGADKFRTFIYRNYTIVKDGLVNVEKLPVKISAALGAYLDSFGVDMEHGGEGVTVINLKPLPIINRKMVKTVSAKALIELEYELTKAKAAQKVFNAYQKELFPEAKLAGWISQFGEQATLWLKEQGLTEYSGFNPKMVQAESTDVYMGKELVVTLKGYSTMPPVDKVKAKLGGKLNGPETLMAEAIELVELFLKSNPKVTHEPWLTGQAKVMTAIVRGITHQMTRIKWGILVGQVWCSEFKSLDENTLNVAYGDINLIGKLDLREVPIKI